jgi:glycosyltransferase involved in cell wall biosynthesis
VEQGSGVLLPPPPDAAAIAGALEPLLVDAGLRRRLGESGREHFSRHFTAEAFAARTRAVYDAALGS